MKAKHEELRHNLDFHCIFPHLNSHGLLPPSLDQVELVDDLGTSQRKIDKVIAYMPKCGKPDFLEQFVDCLKQTAESGTGEAHKELAESIENAYRLELKRYSETGI